MLLGLTAAHAAQPADQQFKRDEFDDSVMP